MRQWMGLFALALTLATTPASATTWPGTPAGAASGSGTGTGASTGTGTGASTGTGTGVSTGTGTGLTTGAVDTGPTGPTFSAADLAGEKGGCGASCSSTGPAASLLGLLLLPVAVGFRRRQG